MTPDELREFAERLRLVEAASHAEAVQLAATRRMLETCASDWEADRKRLARLLAALLDYFASGLSIRAQFNLEAACEEAVNAEVPAATP